MKSTYRVTLSSLIGLSVLAALFLSAWAPAPAPSAQAENPDPPETLVKLIFIHHSCGENWLSDENGGLGRALAENNYFVSDTNYGWGPDAIGDRTDIPHWLEWFRSENTPRYMAALFNESGQNAPYTRTLSDPGGENQIILFKSCFPNSNLDGQPDDPPTPGTDMTVGNAKYVYNEILKYFATRPDKLFVVITAPPVSDPTFARNARAFNNWLVNDWLRQNNYTVPNVAVFDFYNILTGADHHHRFQNGKIEHTAKPGADTAYYPSAGDDDHPSAKGNRKATQEFIPLLNIFYHRWKASAPSQPPANEALPPIEATTVVEEAPEIEEEAPAEAPAVVKSGLLTGFEGGEDNLAFYRDEATASKINCAPSSENPYQGNSALKIEFYVVAGSWATCVLSYDTAQDWSSGKALAFYLRASKAGLPFNIIVYSGSPDYQETYLYPYQSPAESTSNWVLVQIPWTSFQRAGWEAEAGTTFNKPNQITGMAFGLDGLPEEANTGTLWIDNLQLSSGEQPPASTQPDAEEPQPAEEPESQQERGGSRLPCAGALLPLSLLFIWRIAWRK